MDELLYLIIIIILTIFIIFYGGHNDQNKVEYESDYFNNLNTIINFEKKINLMQNNAEFTKYNFININKYFNMTNVLLPNFVNCFLLKINSKDVFNIYDIVDKSTVKNHMMIIFNHHKQNNLELIIDVDYFYNLKKNISITGIYHIYNNSYVDVIVSCFILKKPFWHK